MSDEQEITIWIERLAKGDEFAAQRIWAEYFDKLVRLADKKLRGVARRAADEEDVALSAMRSFCRGLAAGRHDWLRDRQDLWKLLVTITAHKAAHLIRDQRTLKAGQGRVRGESVFAEPDNSEKRGIEQVLGMEPTPEFAASVADEVESRLRELGNDSLRSVALYKLQGYSNREIAHKLGCVERSVEYKLRRIREQWEQGSIGQ